MGKKGKEDVLQMGHSPPLATRGRGRGQLEMLKRKNEIASDLESCCSPSCGTASSHAIQMENTCSRWADISISGNLLKDTLTVWYMCRDFCRTVVWISKPAETWIRELLIKWQCQWALTQHRLWTACVLLTRICSVLICHLSSSRFS